MREIRPSGSEGGGTQTNASFLPLSSGGAGPEGLPRPIRRLLRLRRPDKRVVRATRGRCPGPR